MNIICQGLNPFFTKEWNRHWTNEGAEIIRHQHARLLLPNLIEAQSFEKIVLHRLETHERRIVCRLITGKVGLNQFLHLTNRTPTLNCKWCEDQEETVEHYLMECPRYNILRACSQISLKHLIPELQNRNINLKMLLIGDRRWEPDKRVRAVKETVKFVVETRRNI